MKTNSIIGAIMVAGLCVCPLLRAQSQVQLMTTPTLPTQVLPTQVIYYVPEQQPVLYVNSEISSEAEILLREVRAQHRRTYDETVILHNAKLEELYRQRAAEMKQDHARIAANDKSSSVVAKAAQPTTAH